jgi:alcohol dehydrogenase class IV
MKAFPFATAKKIIFGRGASQQLGDELKKLCTGKVAVITDVTVGSTGALDTVVEVIHKAGLECGVWDKAEAEPSIESGEAAIIFAREGNYSAIVGLGGGSVMDTAKAAAVALRNPGNLSNWVKQVFTNPMGPLVLMPTTAGTGSEVSNAGVFSTSDFKYALYSPLMYPDVALVDPDFTITVPAHITANTGVDALCHAMEAYVSLKATPITDSLALQAIKLIPDNLRAAYACGDNMEARTNMSLAALLAGMAFGNAGTVIGHACGYAYVFPSTPFHFPHGYSIAITMPYVLEYNAIANLEKHATLAAMLGEPIEGLSLRDAAFSSARAFKKLLVDLNFPTSIKDIGVTKDMIPDIAKNVFKSTAHVPRNPRKITEEDMVSLFEKAYLGKLVYE